MVQIVPRARTFTEQLGIALGEQADKIGSSYIEGTKLRGERDTKEKDRTELLKGNQSILRDLEKRRGLEEGSLDVYVNDPKMGELTTRPTKETKTPVGEKPVPPEISKQINSILSANKDATADELRIAMDEAGIPPSYSNPYTENRRRTEEQSQKKKDERSRALRAETLPLRTKLADKAQSAANGIKNKEQLFNLVKQGNINDPTYAALAESLPQNLGKRLLSNDTVAYKAGLVEEFGDLRNIFQGQTRIKEIDLLENKIADIYLTDEQKETILKSRINALKADVIRAEAAAELEDRDDLGILQFNAEVEKIAKPKLDALFNQILDEQKAVIQNSENRKKIPLDINDPEDKKIMTQMLQEAGGSKEKAKELAKKKGYTIKGAR